jgi:hypothetical protein
MQLPTVTAGGWNGVASLRDVHSFDVGSSAWSEVETKGITWSGWAGAAFGLASDGVSLLVFGGHSPSQVMQPVLFSGHFLTSAPDDKRVSCI